MTRPSPGDPGRTSSLAAADIPDFFGPRPMTPPEWPPPGAYPGEPGHPTIPPPLEAPPAVSPTNSFAGPPTEPDVPAPSAAEPVIAGSMAIPPEWPPREPQTVETAQPEPATTIIPAVVGSPSEVTAVFGAPLAAADSGHGDAVEGEVVWHQPPPTEPFHAKHEKPGEWRTHPPDHLAFEHSPPAEVQPGVQHDEPAEAIPLSMLPHPWEVPFDPHHTEVVDEEALPKKRRTGLWVTLALVVTLLLFGGGTASALLLLQNADSGKGSPDPATAVDRFLSSVYTQQNVKNAGDNVCREARDEGELQERIDQIKAYATEYQAPTYQWTAPAVSGQDDERATVAVQLTVITDDEKSAEQQLTFTVIRKTGWLVCEVAG
ncbi:hypothetical protein [Actinoplanes sp. NPDC051859]|uniref:Rv0361 family membrane protein n=1 Tax=Actinoplanes sp. NPDC051859 TaxID=3363909 RepID=UPI00378F93B9